jgi:hypothetical protein
MARTPDGVRQDLNEVTGRHFKTLKGSKMVPMRLQEVWREVNA